MCVLDGVVCVGAVLLGVVCCLDHMAWASAAGMQSMVHRSLPNQQNHTQRKTDAQGPGLATVRDKFANTPVRQCVVRV